MTERKRGRPPKPDGDRLTEVLHIRLTTEEYDAIHDRAAAADRRPPDYVRSVIREAIFRDFK